jgi:hypothetical protein
VTRESSDANGRPRPYTTRPGGVILPRVRRQPCSMSLRKRLSDAGTQFRSSHSEAVCVRVGSRGRIEICGPCSSTSTG